MKLMTELNALLAELNALLAELQTWADSPEANRAAVLKRFARRAQELLHGPEGSITIEYPKEDRALRKLLCQAINQVLEARGVHYQTTGRHFTVLPDAPKTVSKDAICKICDGGPGNHGVCLCGAEAYEDPVPHAPGLPLVPLGKNVTRDGREAFVTGNSDATVSGFVQEFEGSRFMKVLWHSDGTFPGRKGSDLVGHLPPEPVKPKELWSNGTMDVCIEKPADAEERGFRLFREVTPATGKQFHVWVSKDGESIMGAPDIDEDWATGKGYRKAVLMEVKPS